MSSRSVVVLPSALLLSLAGAACDREGWRPDDPTARPKPPVNLPPTPDLTPKDVKARHEDGSFTIAGLLRDRASQGGRTVRVKGVVVEQTLCPKTPPAPPDAPPGTPPPEAPFCARPPHLFLADSKDEDAEKLLVTGSERTAVGLSKVGDTIVVEGLFDVVSPDGKFIRQHGLVALPEPPGAAPGETPRSPEPAE